MKRLIVLFTLGFLEIGSLWSEEVDPILFTAEVVPQMIEISGKGVLEITCVIAFHYYISDTTNGLFEISPQSLQGIRFNEVEYPPGEKGAFGDVYKNNIKVKIPFIVDGESSIGTQAMWIDVTFQACSEDGSVCYLPKTQKLKSEFTVLASPLVNQIYFEKESGIASRLSHALEEGSVISFLLVFLGGILTSLTPCVYPMIPITVAVIGAQTEDGKLHGFILSLFYVFGIATTFSVLGIFVAKTGTLFGSYAQHPFVIIMIASVFFLMGLSMLGVFVLRMPPILTSAFRVKRKGVIGALITGLLAGVIVSPCVSPLLVAILTWVAKTGSVFLGFGLLFSFAMGLGVLFILIGTFS
ncbi:sulfite exporter TauE/SafE family protein, partial [bacterium]|nr:sulfite exporter TauE/SafE family protein [bacterium]